MAQHIDQWMSWYVDVALLVRARYALPQPMQSWVVDNNPAQASHAFALGTYLCLCTHGGESTLADVPAFGAHVAALARLRRRTAARTVHARFRDTRGLTVAGSEGFVAYAYDSPDGPAVIAAATRDACSGSVTLQRDAFTAPGNPREGLVYHLDGRTTPSVGDTHSFTLAAHDVAVWVL